MALGGILSILGSYVSPRTEYVKMHHCAAAGALHDCSDPGIHAAHMNLIPAAPNYTESDYSVAHFKSMHKGDGWFWPEREAYFLERIPVKGAVILDLGAGSMHLKKSLKRTHTAFDYIPVDGVGRDEPSMRICNFKYQQYPVCVKPTPTVVVMQGVMEYIYDKISFLRAFRCAYRNAKILLSIYLDHSAFWMKGLVTPLSKNNIGIVFRELELAVINETKCPHATKCYELQPQQLTNPQLTCPGRHQHQ